VLRPKADTLNISCNVLRVIIIFACDSKRIFKRRNQSSFAEGYGVFLGNYNACTSDLSTPHNSGHSTCYVSQYTGRVGVTISNRLSVSEHVQSVISKCAQSMHALKMLQSHGMSSDALKVIYKSVVLTKLLYASPAWWGFATSADKQRLEAFLSRGVRLNLYSALDPSVSQ